jgi:hypothetical protein
MSRLTIKQTVTSHTSSLISASFVLLSNLCTRMAERFACKEAKIERKLQMCFQNFFILRQRLVSRVAQSDKGLSYGLDGPGIESRWGGEIFRTCPDRPWGPPSLLYKYRVFPGGKKRPGRDADSSPPSIAVVMNG